MSRGSHEPYLLFRSCARIGALSLGDVREVMRPLPLQSIGGAPAFVLGVAIVRGLPCPVIDAGRLLADSTASDASPSASRRLISLKLGTRGACLAVDAVLDVRVLPQDQLHQTPPLLGEAGAESLKLIGAVDRELLLILNTARLVPESVWSAIDSCGTLE